MKFVDQCDSRLRKDELNFAPKAREKHLHHSRNCAKLRHNFREPCKMAPVFNSSRISMKANFNLTCETPIQSLPLVSHAKIDAAQARYLRRILKLPAAYISRVSHKEVRRRCGTYRFSTSIFRICKNRLRYSRERSSQSLPKISQQLVKKLE